MAYSRIRGVLACALTVFALAGCEVLPRGAAVEREIVQAATGEPTDFAVHAVTRDFLANLAAWPNPQAAHLGWIPASGGARTQVIAVGDTLEITIWDSSDSSLLSTPGQRAVQIQALEVAPDGTIFLPYVGDTRVAGMTLQVARQTLQEAINPIVPSSQVQLAMAEGRGNSVDLIGGVAAPGSYPMPDRNFTLLNLIALGGGVQTALTNPQVRLIRAGDIYGTSIARLYANPQLDTLLRGGDRVIVEEDRRYFLSLGAAGQQNQHRFVQDELSALDAISIIGGVQSGRGNPGGVLVLREYPQSALRLDGAGPDQSRVVFTLDLTSADGLFSARNFHLSQGDLVLVTESPITSVQTVFGLVGAVFGLANQSSGLAD